MNEQVDVAFETLPDNVFEQLLGDAPPATTPSAATIQGSTKPAPTTTETTPIAQPIVEKTQAEIDKEIEGASTETPEATITTEETPADVSDIFKIKALGLIERGIWEEFEGMEDFEWTEENYGKLAETQAQWKAEAMYADRISKTGDVGKAIIEHVENGGDPNEIVDLFKAAKRIETFDIKTDTGKESLVTEYYTKVVGWSPTKTAKYVKSLVDEGGERLTEEATEAQDLMNKGIQDQIKATQEQAKTTKLQQEQQAKAWETNMRTVIKERQDLSDKEKRDVQDVLLTYNQKLPDGRQVNKFMVEFMKIQADPKRYVDLVRFVMDPEKYDKKIDKTSTTVAAKKNWDFIKGNQSLSRNTGTSHSKLQEKPKADLVIDYKNLI